MPLPACLLSSALALLAQDAPTGPPTARPPNIVLVLVDDLGWRDLGCQGNDFVDTPHIDALARDGIRFTDAYASSPVCSSTRAALQTGQNPARIGITTFIPGHWRPFERVITPRPLAALPREAVTIAETLRASGHVAGYVGKWHLGPAPRFGPAAQGYEFDVVVDGPHLPGSFRASGDAAPPPAPTQYRTAYEASVAERFIRERAGQPFFLLVSPFAVHIPLAAMADKVAKYRARAEERGIDLPHPVYAAMIEHVDDLVGAIDRALDAAGVRDDTVFVFTSDNGGLTRRYDYRPEVDDVVATQEPLKGEKGTLHEGGIRVPWIVRWPNGVARPGRTCAVPVISHDLLPTFAALAGAELPANVPVDGVDLSPLLCDPDATLSRALIWHFPHYHHGRPASAIRDGRFKLLRHADGSGDRAVHDLVDDPGEARNLVAERPQLAERLEALLLRRLTGMVARWPHPNPAHDPARAAEWWSIATGRPVDSERRRRTPESELDRRR